MEKVSQTIQPITLLSHFVAVSTQIYYYSITTTITRLKEFLQTICNYLIKCLYLKCALVRYKRSWCRTWDTLCETYFVE